MGIAILTLIAGLLALVPVFLNARKNIKANQNEMGKVDDTVLRDSMSAVDRLHPPPAA